MIPIKIFEWNGNFDIKTNFGRAKQDLLAIAADAQIHLGESPKSNPSALRVWNLVHTKSGWKAVAYFNRWVDCVADLEHVSDQFILDTDPDNIRLDMARTASGRKRYMCTARFRQNPQIAEPTSININRLDIVMEEGPSPNASTTALSPKKSAC